MFIKFIKQKKRKMNKEERLIQARLKWVKMYEEIGHATKVCHRCGISRPTLRLWIKRYKAEGGDGLRDKSRRPHHSPGRKIFSAQEQLILKIRKEKRFGVRRIQTELRRHYDLKFALGTIHRVLIRHNINRFKHKAKPRRQFKRYQKNIPGERVQLDVFKVAPGIYQYTAIDDCTRFRVLDLQPRKNGKATLRFLDKVLKEMPFPIQRFQTDRGREFLADEVQYYLMDLKIKLRPNKPRSPHLNGKVERSQKTDWDEFYSYIDLKGNDLADRLSCWQHEYNALRLHSSLSGRTPLEKLQHLKPLIPSYEEVAKNYDPSKERLREANYYRDCIMTNLPKLKGSL